MDKKELTRYIKFYDGNQENLAKAMNLSRSRLNAKMNGRYGAEFTKSEIVFIVDRYHLTQEAAEKIFG